VASGDVLSGAVAALAEMLYRMSWRVGKTYTFPVQDWQMCEGGWGGTIVLVTTMRGVANSSGEGWFNSEAMDSVETTEVELTGSSKSGSAWTGSSHGTYSTNLEANPIYISRKSSCSLTTRRHGVASGSGDVDYSIDLPGGDVVQVSPAVNMPYVDLTDSETVECSGCPGNGGGCKPNPTYTTKRAVELPGVRATVDPQSPGVLRGSLTQGTASRMSRTITWNLVQCGK
jgi:hypothetical protein